MPSHAGSNYRSTMRIMLRPGPGDVIGDADGQPLSYRDRTPLIGGQPVCPADIATALVDAVDEAATRVFGPVWVKKLGLVAGLGLRRCQRDRIEQFGLPPRVLRVLGAAAACDNARALGDMMLAVARLHDAAAVQSGADRPDWPSARGTVQELSAEALKLVEALRPERG